MSQFNDNGLKTFEADAAVAQHARVTMDADGKVTVAGVNEAMHGTAEREAFASGEKIAVRLFNHPGTRKVIANAAITAGNVCYAAADGEVAPSGTVVEGVALEAAAADQDIIEMLPLVASQTYIPKAAQQALSGAGAVNVTTFYTAVTTTGADALTLADGVVTGQLKKVQLIVDGGDGTLTPANLNGGTTITFADAGDYALLVWDGAGWTALELGNDADGATAPVLA